MLDYEVELVAVIGKKGRHISREEAPAYVFGYAVGNDVTVRDWQQRRRNGCWESHSTPIARSDPRS